MSIEKDLPGQVLRNLKTVEAKVLFACAACGAPGAYNSHESIRAGWPACWVERGDPQEGEQVGDICPQCGTKRPAPDDRGVIWTN
jgi:predicted RNA-binding Zn-ribbon protein involved in translation (DUF1610 family)